jgi:Zn-dependent M28 family amino/carboxypeptidase
MIRCRRATLLLVFMVAAGGCVDATRATAPSHVVADASAVACTVRANNTIAKLTACVTLDAVRAHQAALQGIADANGDTRAAGTPGYDASADYVAARLAQAGYVVTRQQVTYMQYVVLDADLEQLSPFAATYGYEFDFDVLTNSPSGDVTAPVTPVDLEFGDDNASTSGCEAADFAGFPVGSIALLQRGTCPFEVKALNAQAAGAAAVIIFNQGNNPLRLGLINGTLSTPTAVTIPVVGATYARGVEWASTPALVMRVQVNASNGTLTTENVIAELPGSPGDQVVMAGAHLDGVRRGPGINDNGSGAAALLETAIQMARVSPRNTVRFAWWGGHEDGLRGSSQYLGALTAAEIGAIALYVDFHLLGSPNFVRFVYDGDGSVSGGAGPAGSAGIERVLGGLYSARGLAFEEVELGGGSDHASFAAQGIPVGGITTGSTGVKTPAQQAIFGGTAGDQFDPCFHLSCDTYANVSLQALDENADITAAAVLTFGMTTEAVNGVKGRGNFKRSAAPAVAAAIR